MSGPVEPGGGRGLKYLDPDPIDDEDGGRLSHGLLLPGSHLGLNFSGHLIDSADRQHRPKQDDQAFL